MTCPPSMHPPLPQVVSLGGPVIAKPVVQPITYLGDPDAAAIDAFLQELVTTTYWSQTTSEYGVGALTVKPTFVQNHAAPATIDDATLQTHIQTNTSGPSPAWGPPDASTIYLFVIPPGTVETRTTGAGTQTCCTEYDGYHGEAMVGTPQIAVPYAVACACPQFQGTKVAALAQRTGVTSHELVEAATDPFPRTNPAFTQPDDAHFVWKLVGAGEVGDLCELDGDAFITVPGGAATIQRTWSNQAAKSHTNPCVPVVTAEPYLFVAPALPDMVSIPGVGVTTPAVKIPVGQTKTIDVDLLSECGSTLTWSVHAYDVTSFLQGTQPYLGLAFDQGTGKSGETLHLTIKVESAATTAPGGLEPFMIVSSDAQQSAVWMGLVTQ
jgi:hypothetical protein